MVVIQVTTDIAARARTVERRIDQGVDVKLLPVRPRQPHHGEVARQLIELRRLAADGLDCVPCVAAGAAVEELAGAWHRKRKRVAGPLGFTHPRGIEDQASP